MSLCCDIFLVFQREDAVEQLKKDQVKSDKRIKALKERMKKMAAPASALTDTGPKNSVDDEVFENEEENE